MSKENAVVEEILEHLSQATPEFQKEILSVVTELRRPRIPMIQLLRKERSTGNEGT